MGEVGTTRNRGEGGGEQEIFSPHLVPPPHHPLPRLRVGTQHFGVQARRGGESLALVIGNWCLKFVCDLGFVIWNLFRQVD
jgi:hypothetical protein